MPYLKLQFEITGLPAKFLNGLFQNGLFQNLYQDLI